MEVSWRDWIVNRVTLSLTVIGIITLAWNGYRMTHADGIITGSVVGPNEGPVAGATVTLWKRVVATVAPQAHTTTDAEGRFRFVGHDQYELLLSAEKAGVGKTSRHKIELYFRGENWRLDKPLRLEQVAQ